MTTKFSFDFPINKLSVLTGMLNVKCSIPHVVIEIESITWKTSLEGPEVDVTGLLDEVGTKEFWEDIRDAAEAYYFTASEECEHSNNVQDWE
jgi:hypothetical protein